MSHHNHCHLVYPYFKQVETGMPSYAPRTVSSVGAVMTGSTADFGENAIRGAYGEFFERNHFMLNVLPACRARLDKVSEPVRAGLLNVFNAVKKTADNPAEFDWRLVTVNNLFNEKEDLYPYVFLSLYNDSHEEAAFLPHADSSGCAAHNTKARALYKATMEWLERQALVAGWALKRAKREIDAAALRHIKGFTGLADELLNNGELHVYDLAHGLPGYAIVITYFAKSSQDTVQYAIGASFDLNCEKAMAGAMGELWQDYYYLYGADAYQEVMKDLPGVSYNFEHIKDNKPQTRDLIPFKSLPFNQRLKFSDVQALPTIDWNEALNKIKVISSAVVYYHYHDKMRDLHVAKVHSPDFFLHMSLAHPNNVDNLYARSVGIASDKPLSGRIPFP